MRKGTDSKGNKWGSYFFRCQLSVIKGIFVQNPSSCRVQLNLIAKVFVSFKFQICLAECSLRWHSEPCRCAICRRVSRCRTKRLHAHSPPSHLPKIPCLKDFGLFVLGVVGKPFCTSATLRVTFGQRKGLYIRCYRNGALILSPKGQALSSLKM